MAAIGGGSPTLARPPDTGVTVCCPAYPAAVKLYGIRTSFSEYSEAAMNDVGGGDDGGVDGAAA